MEAIRLISIFDKKTEKLIDEVNIDYIELNVLKEIFKPKENDPLMYNPYTIRKKHLKKNESIY